MYARLASLWIALMLVLTASAWGAGERQVNASFKTGAIYVPGRWLPTQIRCSNPTDTDVRGYIIASTDSSAGSYELVYPLHVPPNSLVFGEMLTTIAPPKQTRVRSDKPEPATTFFWRSAEGAELAREPVYAVADSAAMGGGSEATGVSGVSVLYVTSDFTRNEADDPSDLPSVIGRDSSYRFTLNAIDPARLSRRTLAFDAVRLIIIDQASLRLIDPTQQQALLDHVKSGATMLVVPTDAGVGQTWIGPLLPLDLVGMRESGVIESREFPPVKFTRVHPHHVAIARPDTTTVVSDPENAWAAYREVGFGRIAMAAFPINAMDRNDPNASAIWTRLVGTSRLAFHDPAALDRSPSDSAKDPSLVAVLPSMVGATAPPWKTAAIISLAYTGAVAVVLLVIGAKRRPLAIAGCVAGGVVLAGGVLGMSALKSSDEPLMLARLSVVDVSGDVACRDDLITFFGEAPLAGIDYETPNNAAASAIIATGKRPPRVTMFPFRVAGVSSSMGTFASVWEIKSIESRPQSIRASLAFGPDGAKLNVDSPQPSQVESPRLIFGGSVMPIAPIAPGTQSISVGARNAPGDYSGGEGVIANEESKLRTEVLMRTESRIDPILGRLRRTLEPRLVGFESDAGPDLKTSVEVTRRGQTLMRTEVVVEPTPIGTEVRVDPGFTHLRRDAAVSLPYRAEGDAWSEASQGGPWMVAIAAPPEIGKLAPKRLSLEIDLRATGYEFTIQRGQVQSGKMSEAPAGEAVLQWSNTDAAKRATIELTPDDIDENGWVWIRIAALPAVTDSLIGSLGGGSGVLPNWRILRFDATLTGTIVAPPQPVIKTWPTELPPPPAPKPAPKPKPKKK